MLCSTTSNAATITILSSNRAGDIANGDGDDDLNLFYQNEGFSSSIVTGELNTGNLTDTSLLVAMLPDDAFTGSELTVLSNYLSTGGSILFMGEQEGFAAAQNAFLNSALSALGSSMTIGTTSVDSGFNDTSAGQVLAHPLNATVSLINYGNVNSISGVPTGGELFLAKDLTTVWGGVETIGNGSIVVLADTNMISNIENTAGNDNHAFFVNVVP